MKKFYVYLKTTDIVEVETSREPDFKSGIGWIFYLKNSDKNYVISKVFPIENILYFERV